MSRQGRFQLRRRPLSYPPGLAGGSMSSAWAQCEVLARGGRDRPSGANRCFAAPATAAGARALSRSAGGTVFAEGAPRAQKRPPFRWPWYPSSLSAGRSLLRVPRDDKSAQFRLMGKNCGCPTSGHAVPPQARPLVGQDFRVKRLVKGRLGFPNGCCPTWPRGKQDTYIERVLIAVGEREALNRGCLYVCSN